MKTNLTASFSGYAGKTIKTLFISLVILSLSMIYSGCTSSGGTEVEGSWKKPGYAGKKFTNILVLAISNDIVKRSKIETAVVKQLSSRKVSGGSATNVINYNELEQSQGRLDTAKIAEIKRKLSDMGYDGVLVISLLDIKEKQEYVPGYTYYEPSVYVNPGFYNYWYSTYSAVHTTGYYVNNTSIYLETRLFDLSNDEVLWAGQTVTTNPSDLSGFSASYASAIVAKLGKDKMIN